MDAPLHIETHTSCFGPVKCREEILMEEDLIFRCFDVAVEHAVISEKSKCDVIKQNQSEVGNIDF